MKGFKTDYQFGFHDRVKPRFKTKKGLSEQVVREISAKKDEPKWMLEFRLKALKVFEAKKMPTWGADLSKIDFNELTYYLEPTEKTEKRWQDVPKDIKNTFDRLGIPEAEKKYLAGVKSQYDSQVVYGSLKKELADKGVIFLGFDEAVQKYPRLVKKYLGTVIPIGDNKFAALNSAVWSGGSFVYVPARVKVDKPLQAYFRINEPQFGQFERTLIIAEEDSSVHYGEGCTAPAFSEGSLHAAVVEIIVKKRARVQYTTVQNWYKNVYNLVTKRAWVGERGEMIWTDANLGARVTMKYPSFILAEEGARGETLSVALAGEGQHQDVGSKATHLAPDTRSIIVSKSISLNGGRSTYRGLVNVARGAKGAKSKVICDALILDPKSRTDTYPTNKIFEKEVTLEHEATVSKVGEEQLFYLTSRGLSQTQAMGMVVNGFIEPVVKKLPMEYAVEMNRLIDLEMEGSVG
ncbi:MAG: Iron-regulated ABC transporter membrane component SufB [Candidatus Beckwithbacteria bacterium GW2011_GWB1_47_15]|uniref:Iron-regulated ABC transporter membrane component SufB n=1 Tax=Candidatus Beckwithbacteria bacterium GW2011_GWB1_47_15 TaxID=1618371 RepID=A0A0G1UU46_9BACT|nr:MAG: Iron-regulated ABC transporter membrane component SufB, Fe-S cluster assembly protein SufB [Candidatus Beckwithbacteria bacterium GW2011_GWC1_49_16]KKU35020.1 MAG: Iron-regulated ABC transporter membrane component SufB [Candidatus Beckwithbacteria bacterium GW2011_GWA1_46_30]KKU61235.1 MAG: Iron-regulated ABC transporter membrane component SufB [Candidatus Beckwithbacteria bacterium GW2011_GWB1_47_15]KKU71471.1 MAG: Iron-regulated ABC transporter membrane component SufB [Candidatus Beckw